MKLYAVPWIYADHGIDVQGPTSFGLCIVCILGEFPAVIYERQKSRNTEQADSIPEISHSEAPSTSVFQAPHLAEEPLNIDAYCDLYYDVSSSETIIYKRQKSRNVELADSIPEISQSETPSTSVFQAPQLAEELQNIDAYCDLNYDVSSSETVIYERQKKRNTEQADSIPEISQSETPSTSVFQAPQLAEELHYIDADCDLNYDKSSSGTHNNPYKSKFVLYCLTPYCDKSSFYDT